MSADHLSHARTKGFWIIQWSYRCTHHPHPKHVWVTRAKPGSLHLFVLVIAKRVCPCCWIELLRHVRSGTLQSTPFFWTRLTFQWLNTALQRSSLTHHAKWGYLWKSLAKNILHPHYEPPKIIRVCLDPFLSFTGSCLGKSERGSSRCY